MEKEILKEICKDLNWKDRIIVKFSKKTFFKVYHRIRRSLFNNIIDN